MPLAKKALKNVITTRVALTNILLLTNAFVWYFYLFTILQDISSNIASDEFTTLLMWGVHFAGAIFSALIGTIWMKRSKRNTFLISWMLLGVVSSLFSIIGPSVDTSGLLAISFLFGVSFGIGMPNCMGYFADYTPVEKRGRLGGIIMLVNGLGMFLLGIISIESLVTKSLVLAGWRMAGLVIFLLIKPPEENKGETAVSYRSVINQRPFILYLIPWILFSLVNYLSLPILSNILDSSIVESSMSIGNILSAFSAIVGGFLSDVVGRKRMATAGFVMLGIGYTILGIAPENISSLYFYSVIDGIAWGFLFVIFVITVWGDLSYGAPSDKYYAIAGSPFFVSLFLRSAIGPYVAEVSPYAIFSFAAFFLFLAVLPLMYAPETLPEKTMKDRELKNYIEKAQKEAEKVQRKDIEDTSGENEDNGIEFEGEEFEEKLKEAEKYY
jgi:MFS family permease